MNPHRRLAAFAIVALLALQGACSWPIFDPEKLRAIRAEARTLTAVHAGKSADRWTDVPKAQWPPAIASLQPDYVIVYDWGVSIMTKADFDGGWGYHIPQDRRNLPMPADCYSEVSAGVFWHPPC